MKATTDAYWEWQVSVPSEQPTLSHWLQDTGSLTERLRLHSTQFRVQLLSTHSQVPLTAEQASWLGEDQAYCREVLLLCDEQPWIYASSLYSNAAHDAVPALGDLGPRALGELLFDHPALVRSRFEFAQLSGPQCQQLTHNIQQQSRQFELFTAFNSTLLERESCEKTATPMLPWARRSLLSIPEASVLVSELFLPVAVAYRE